MSIFKGTFKQGVQDQLDIRQEAINNRSAQNLTYYNSRNAWVRMISAVNVKGDNGALAKKYILQGGILDPNKHLRSGVGEDGAYNNTSETGVTYRLGLRPMPGINSIELKSLAAYGSTREATVNFQCWDIHQLEDLELLYMRPGYSIMLEWGWSPYLKNNGDLEYNVQFIDDVLNGGISKEVIWKKIFDKATTDGNYDAIYGFIKNYSWKARKDGGYDCVTTIVSMGSMLESLKINYVSTDSDVGTMGVFGDVGKVNTPSVVENVATAGAAGTFNDIANTAIGITKPMLPNSFIAKAYSQNMLAGVISELYATALFKSGLQTKTVPENLDFSAGGGLVNTVNSISTAAPQVSAGGNTGNTGTNNTPSGVNYSISKAPTGLIKTSQGNVSVCPTATAPALVVFGGIDVNNRKSGDYMWDYMGNLKDKYHIFVADNAKIDGNAGYNEFLSTLKSKNITPSRQILYLFSGGYYPGMAITPSKANIFESIFLVDIWMGSSDPSNHYKSLVDNYKAKTKYIYTTFGAQNETTRDYIASHAGYSVKQSDNTHMNTNLTALQYL